MNDRTDAPGVRPASADGACLCGAVRFSATLPGKWVAHCHCTRCQRAHGAAFVTWAGFDAAAVVIHDPAGRLVWHAGEGGARRSHCAVCGSPMFFESPRWAGELHIARALFLDPLDREPMSHVFAATAVPWVTLGDALPRQHDSGD